MNLLKFSMKKKLKTTNIFFFNGLNTPLKDAPSDKQNIVMKWMKKLMLTLAPTNL